MQNNHEPNKEDVLSKIKKCFSLTKSSNTNEAQVALRQAYALMKKHNLSLHDVEVSEIAEQEAKTDNKKKIPGWVTSLAHTIARLMNCEIFCRSGLKKSISFVYVGQKENAEIAQYTFIVLYRALKKHRLEFIKSEVDKRKYSISTAYKTRIGDAFCNGWVLAVKEKIKDLLSAELSEEDEKTKAVVKSYMKEKYKFTDTQKSLIRSQKGLYGAVTDGFSKGLDVNLNVPLNGCSKEQKLLSA